MTRAKRMNLRLLRRIMKRHEELADATIQARKGPLSLDLKLHLSGIAQRRRKRTKSDTITGSKSHLRENTMKFVKPNGSYCSRRSSQLLLRLVKRHNESYQRFKMKNQEPLTQEEKRKLALTIRDRANGLLFSELRAKSNDNFVFLPGADLGLARRYSETYIKADSIARRLGR